MLHSKTACYRCIMQVSMCTINRYVLFKKKLILFKNYKSVCAYVSMHIKPSCCILPTELLLGRN